MTEMLSQVLLERRFVAPETKNLGVLDENENKIVYEDGFVYHKDNRLNDLTNKVWLKFQKSWFILNPKPRENDVKLHPAKFPEELVSDFVKFFTKKEEIVFDPMVGTGSTLISSILEGRSCIGIELLEKYALIAKERIERLLGSQQITDFLTVPQEKKWFVKLIVGNALNISEMNLPEVDYCITSPPYWDMLTEKGGEIQSERSELGLDVSYSNDENDLGNVHEYEKFIELLVSVYKQVYELLKPGKYLTIIVKNIKKKGKIYPLAWDLSKRLSELSFFDLKDEKIWCQDNTNLFPYGYRYSWVSNTVHHYCLNFQKV